MKTQEAYRPRRVLPVACPAWGRGGGRMMGQGVSRPGHGQGEWGRAGGTLFLDFSLLFYAFTRYDRILWCFSMHNTYHIDGLRMRIVVVLHYGTLVLHQTEDRCVIIDV